MLTKEYQDHLTKQLDAMQGEVSMYYKNMITGETFAYHEKDALMPASVIKLPIFLHYLELAAEGKADPKEKRSAFSRTSSCQEGVLSAR